MPRIETDFANVESPVAAGMYRCEVTGSQIKPTKSDGSTMIVWELTIIEEGDYLGRKLYYNSNLADKRIVKEGPMAGQPDTDAVRKANYYLRELLRKFGCEYDPTGFDTESAMHCQCVAETQVETFEGREMTRVKNILATQETQEAQAAAK